MCHRQFVDHCFHDLTRRSSPLFGLRVYQIKARPAKPVFPNESFLLLCRIVSLSAESFRFVYCFPLFHVPFCFVYSPGLNAFPFCFVYSPSRSGLNALPKRLSVVVAVVHMFSSPTAATRPLSRPPPPPPHSEISESRRLSQARCVSKRSGMVLWSCGLWNLIYRFSKAIHIEACEVSEMPASIGHRNVRKICFARSSIMELPETSL